MHDRNSSCKYLWGEIVTKTLLDQVTLVESGGITFQENLSQSGAINEPCRKVRMFLAARLVIGMLTSMPQRSY